MGLNRAVIVLPLELFYIVLYKSVAGRRSLLLWIGLSLILSSLFAAATGATPFYAALTAVLFTIVVRPGRLFRRFMKPPQRTSSKLVLISSAAIVDHRGCPVCGGPG